MQYARVFWRRRWVVLGTCLAIAALATLYSLRQPRVYAAQTTLIIDAAPPQFLDGNIQDVTSQETSSYWYQQEYLQTQQRVIVSRAVAMRVVDKLGLQSDAAFLGLAGISDPELRAEAMRDADAAQQLQAMIQVKPVKDSRLMELSIKDGDPERAALLVNEVAEAYIQETLSQKLKTTESATRWLEERLGELSLRSEKSELEVFDFKKNADVLTMSLEDRQNMVSQQLTTYNQALADTRTRLAALQGRQEALDEVKRKSGALNDPDDALWRRIGAASADNKLVMDLLAKLATQRADCADVRARYLEQHPATLTCQDKVSSLEQALEREFTRALQQTSTELTQEASRERKLVALLEQTKAEAFAVNKKQLEYDQLDREAGNNRRLHEAVLKRLKDIELSGLVRTSNVRVLDAARPLPDPVSPRPLRALFLGVALGMALGLALALLLEQLDNTISSQEEIEHRLGLPFLGFAPLIAEATSGGPAQVDLQVHQKPQSAMAECFRAIRTNLLFMTPDKPFKRLLVTSSLPEEGKSTTAVSLGIAMAQMGERTLLIDTDMRRPRLHRALGVSGERGVSTLIVGEADLKDCVKSTEVPNLFLLPCGPLPPNPAELLHTEAFEALLARASLEYDRIILDSPPVGAVADAAVLSHSVDGVVLVVQAGRSQRAAAQRTVRSLMDVRARLFGVVLNQLDDRAARESGYYGGYPGHGSYYGERPDGQAA